MTRKSTKSASREWSGPRPTPEAVRTPPYGFRVPQQNASVHADPWSSGQYRLRTSMTRETILRRPGFQRRQRQEPKGRRPDTLQIGGNGAQNGREVDAG
jgi:hypothetical protein